MATCNGITYVKAQIDSILQQEHLSVTLFISDDESTDGTWEYLQSCNHEQIVVLSRTGGFGTAAANFFRLIRDVPLAGFDYVALADQDDLWFPGKLKRATATLERLGADIYSGNVVAFWPDGRKMLINKAQPQRQWDHLFEAAGPGCTYVLQIKVACQLQAFLHVEQVASTNIVLHDWLIYAWARNLGLLWHIDQEPMMHYRQHANNVVGINQGIRAAIKRIGKLRDGWYLRQIRCIADMIGLAGAPPVHWLNQIGFFNKLRLIMAVTDCRRRFRDRLGFILFIVLLR
ncbi:glycosyltransferase [Chitinibacter sp. FCG-7]|uniref:Glycosyltransferase n=1 Tax=Chitinibacter mangrovi TaxID=3153927 RepID=A0AAU7FFV1_9NEIS